jgi:energy-coupling factor transporter ATP-binding protein EcfA2
MEQPTANNQDTFIERVRLQGYKSIEDVEIMFKPGLNILIGANGSGKTNFVRFLDVVLSEKYSSKVGSFESEVVYRANKKKYAHWLEYKALSPGKSSLGAVNHKVIIDDKKEIKTGGWGLGATEEWFIWYREWQNILRPTLISYGVSEDFGNINAIAKTEIVGNTLESNRYLEVQPSLSEGLYQLFYRLFSSIIDSDDGEKINRSFPPKFLENLSFYTPVKDIRLEPGYRVEPTKNGKEILHVRFEFFVDGKWRPWTHLSDGTKRLVYIITEVTFANNIILLEEPELGIHPHQLSKLMDFLEAAAEHKQIILTTHSPQVLNVLHTNELDRIIVVRYEKDNGTKMSHLTEEEQEHARTYMEAGGLDLSDYWVHSSLEKETESV